MRFIHSIVFFLFCVTFSTSLMAQYIDNIQSIEETAQNLVKKTTNPKKKAEILAVFIAKHFERDGFLKKEKEKAAKHRKIYTAPYQNNLWEAKIGDSYQFADLYQQMCESVGLKTIVIEGYAGHNIEPYSAIRPQQKAVRSASSMISGREDTSLERYKSAWNAVQINNKWILVDTYWMIKGEKYSYNSVSNKKRMERIFENNKKRKLTKKNASLDMDFFDIPPKQMIKTHYPFDETYQFLKQPYSLNRFLSQ